MSQRTPGNISLLRNDPRPLILHSRHDGEGNIHCMAWTAGNFARDIHTKEHITGIEARYAFDDIGSIALDDNENLKLILRPWNLALNIVCVPRGERGALIKGLYAISGYRAGESLGAMMSNRLVGNALDAFDESAFDAIDYQFIAHCEGAFLTAMALDHFNCDCRVKSRGNGRIPYDISVAIKVLEHT